MKHKLIAGLLTLTLLCSVLVPIAGASAAQPLTWPKTQAMPSFPTPAETLDAVNMNDMPYGERATIAVLQGLVNREQPRIIVMGGYQEEPLELWPQELGLHYSFVDDWKTLVLQYRSLLKGLMVYNPAVHDTLNLATTAAGLNDCLVASPELAEILSAAPYNLPVVTDFNALPITNRLEAYEYLYNNYWPQCNKRLLFGLSNTEHMPLRDLSVAVGGAVLWLDPVYAEEEAMLTRFFNDLETGASYAGWWAQEGDGIGYSTRAGIPTIPADHFMNYSVYSGMTRKVNPPAVPAKPALQDGKIYVSLNYSDGDNIQYIEHALRRTSLWESPDRGKVPIGWTFSPMLLDAAPQMMEYFYQTATPNDVLVAGPSGAGYATVGDWRSLSALKAYTDRTNDYFERTNINVITTWGWMFEPFAEVYARAIPSLIGMTMQERYFQRLFVTTNHVPVVWFGNDQPGGTGLTYEWGTEKTKTQLSQIADAGIERTQFYAAQFLSWETPVTQIADMVDELNAAYPGRFEFVRTDHFMMLLNESQGRPFGASLQKSVNASSSAPNTSAQNAVDGTFSTGWQAGAAGESWLQIDLGEAHCLERYVLENASSNGLDAALNTRAWQIQTSENGVDGWQTIDSKKGNTGGVVYRKLPKVQARYVRILVTDPGADGIARIQDLEIFATPAAAQKSIADRLEGIPAMLTQLLWNVQYLIGFLKGLLEPLLGG